MSKKRYYRVVVDPQRSVFGFTRLDGGDMERKKCEEIVADIKRHVDNIGYCNVEVESASCEYCGADWTEAGDDYNGGCCDRDEEMRKEAK